MMMLLLLLFLPLRMANLSANPLACRDFKARGRFTLETAREDFVFPCRSLKRQIWGDNHRYFIVWARQVKYYYTDIKLISFTGFPSAIVSQYLRAEPIGSHTTVQTLPPLVLLAKPPKGVSFCVCKSVSRFDSCDERGFQDQRLLFSLSLQLIASDLFFISSARALGIPLDVVTGWDENYRRSSCGSRIFREFIDEPRNIPRIHCQIICDTGWPVWVNK